MNGGFPRPTRIRIFRRPNVQASGKLRPRVLPDLRVGYPVLPASSRCPMTVLLCHCTCPDAATAESIATALVEERLAACASVQPGVGSVYRWQGRVETAEEVLLAMKTTRDRFDALARRIHALHPYEVPELLAFEATAGSPAYLDWVVAETRAETAS